jgi:protein-tyrosine phosphatase
VHEGSWLLLGWFAVGVIAVAIAYVRDDVRVFGKRSDGKRALGSMLLLWPYLCLSAAVWHAARLVVREPAVSHVAGTQLWLARRLLARELPQHVRVVVDLTCELIDPAQLRAVPTHVCFPILDARAPKLADLHEALERVADADAVLIHCAQGHGRTGLFAAALLLRRGLAQTPEQALARVIAARPRVRLSAVQTRALHDYAQLLAQMSAQQRKPVE